MDMFHRPNVNRMEGWKPVELNPPVADTLNNHRTTSQPMWP